MATESLYHAKPRLAFAKLVATPTATAWSQVYNAGNLFACLSITIDEPRENISLSSLGKEIFNNLEAEFFSLTEKNLKEIKSAIQTSLQDIPEDVFVNLSLAFFKDEILYLYIAGQGKIVLKRGSKVGTILEKEDRQESLITASGLLQHEDSIVLETKHFADSISDNALASAMELALPNDIAEALSPQIHEHPDGGQAAIIITYHGINKTPVEENDENEIEEQELDIAKPLIPPHTYHHIQDETKPQKEEPTVKRTPLSLKKYFRKLRLPSYRLNTRKRIILGIIILLLGILIFSIVSTKQKQQNTIVSEQFQSVYTPAQHYYDEGKSVQSIEKNVALDDFNKADQLIKANSNKFPAGSKEQKQLSDLLQKVDAELGTSSDGSKATNLQEASLPDKDILTIEKNNHDAVAMGEDSNAVYGITDKAIFSVDKTSGTKKDIIKNNNDWQSPQAIAPYQGNIYVLDKKNGILKFVSGSDGFGKTAYFSSNTPDLSKTNAIAIDGSIWLLNKDGSIVKYTKGKADSFKISGLDKAFSQPVKLYTSRDIDNLYILDPSNERVVKLAKSGTFVSSYKITGVNQAQDFEVSETDKKIYILSNNKIYQVSME